MKKLALALILVPLTSFATSEPQTIVPEKDAAILRQFPNLYKGGEHNSEIFTTMIIGQDDSSGANRTRDGRPMLASRSDIMMFLSVNLRTHESAILTLYRDHPPTMVCEDRMGRGAPDGKINGVYSIYGRQGFIPCIEAMMEEMIVRAGPQMSARFLDRGRFRVNAFFEMTRSLTLTPLAKDLIWTAFANVRTLTGRYGAERLAQAIKVIYDERAKKVDTAQLQIELKERHAYRAHGYQRAFNNAWAIATALGWAAYGINSAQNENYEFMGKMFGHIINKHFSRSIDFNVLEKNVFMKNGDHAFRYFCYNQGASPIKIYLWDDNGVAYATFDNGRIKTNREHTDLAKLKIVRLLPDPPSCD